jgi:hypothetical protein
VNIGFTIYEHALGASAQAQMTEDMMHDIADLIYKRILKGKAPPQE